MVNGREDLTTLASTLTGSSARSAPTLYPKKQAGIPFLLIDMNTPGITLRLTAFTTAQLRAVMQVWFEDVWVPADQLVGEEKSRADVRQVPHGNERTGIAQVARPRSSSAEGEGSRWR